jgi:hypothetical protein
MARSTILVLLSLATLLALGSSPVRALPEAGASNSAEDPVTIAADAAEASADASTPCSFGMCKEAAFVEPKVQTLIRSDVMPGFFSPALTPSVEPEAGC